MTVFLLFVLSLLTKIKNKKDLWDPVHPSENWLYLPADLTSFASRLASFASGLALSVCLNLLAHVDSVLANEASPLANDSLSVGPYI